MVMRGKTSWCMWTKFIVFYVKIAKTNFYVIYLFGGMKGWLGVYHVCQRKQWSLLEFGAFKSREKNSVWSIISSSLMEFPLIKETFRSDKSGTVFERVNSWLKPPAIGRVSSRSGTINAWKESKKAVVLCCELKGAIYRFAVIVLMWEENLEWR